MVCYPGVHRFDRNTPRATLVTLCSASQLPFSTQNIYKIFGLTHAFSRLSNSEKGRLRRRIWNGVLLHLLHDKIKTASSTYIPKRKSRKSQNHSYSHKTAKLTCYPVSVSFDSCNRRASHRGKPQESANRGSMNAFKWISTDVLKALCYVQVLTLLSSMVVFVLEISNHNVSWDTFSDFLTRLTVLLLLHSLIQERNEKKRA